MSALSIRFSIVRIIILSFYFISVVAAVFTSDQQGKLMTHETRKQVPLGTHEETEHPRSNGQTQN